MINTQPLFRVLNQNIRKIFIEVSVLDKRGSLIGVLKGYTLDGTINLSSGNSYRRSGRLRMIVDNKIDFERLFWFDSSVKIRIGMKDFLTNEIFWFELGEFAVKNMSITDELNGKTAEIQMLDMMAFLDGSLGGIIKDQVTFDSKNNIPIHEAIRSTLSLLGITKTSIESISVNGDVKSIPYTLEFNAGTSAFEIINTLMNLYKGYECFFDTSGLFVLRRIRDRKNDVSVFHFSKDASKLSVGNTKEIDFGKVKNSIAIYGYENEYGTQIAYRCRNRYSRNDYISMTMINDAIEGDICHVSFENKSYIYGNGKWVDLGFNVIPLFNMESIGERAIVTEDGNIFNVDQAKTNAEYQMFTYSNFGEELSLSTVPIYGLDVNNKITTDVIGDCLIQSLNIPLNISDTMNILATKIY